MLKGGGECELSYAVPRDADRARFAGLFRALEQNLCRLRLAGCGVSDTTLEEVPGWRVVATLRHAPRATW